MKYAIFAETVRFYQKGGILLTEYHFPGFSTHWISFPGILYSLNIISRDFLLDCASNARAFQEMCACTRNARFGRSSDIFQVPCRWGLSRGLWDEIWKKNFFFFRSAFFQVLGTFRDFLLYGNCLCSTFSKSWAFSGIFYSSIIIYVVHFLSSIYVATFSKSHLNSYFFKVPGE